MTQGSLFNPDFFPTPNALIEKMISGLKWSDIETILEPSAGNGNIAELIQKRYCDSYGSYGRDKEIDVIEIEPELQMILKGKGFHLIHDNFLTFESRKTYDLIIANFPFSRGVDHLLHAIDLLERNGGRLVCLVNAETIRNREASNHREVAYRRLEAHGASIEFLPAEFRGADRSTDVEVALIRMEIDLIKQGPSIILDSLREASKIEEAESSAPLLPADFRLALIAQFNFEADIGLRLIREYESLRPYIKDRFKKPGESSDYSSPLLELHVRSSRGSSSAIREGAFNDYLKGLREKYWELLIRDERFSRSYTSNILDDLEKKLKELRRYDFTIFNIEQLEIEMQSKITRGIEDSILKLFDEFSRKFAYDESIHNGNVHYYNGWKSNQAHKINMKIIQPMNGFSSWKWDKQDRLEHHIHKTLVDMVKVFNYLAGEKPNTHLLVSRAVEMADQTKSFRDMDLRYFTTTFYKKGTCHIKFLDPDLLAKFNIFGSQRKGWLPPAYGKKAYDDMTLAEQAVIDSFQGREEYEKVMLRKDYFLVDTSRLLIGNGEEDGQ